MNIRKVASAKVYYITLSVYRYIDFFTRRDYNEFLLEWLKLYQTEYGLVIYDWIIMTNHVHLIASSVETDILSLLADFKRSSSIQFLEMIETGRDDVRRSWFLQMFRTSARERIFWRSDLHCQGIYKMSFYLKQQQAMYRDPVRQGLVFHEKDYQLSSCHYKENKDAGAILPVADVSSAMFQEEEEIRIAES